MIEAIQTYDLCIADLTGHNPNVFYELALAQAARRPVVMLKLAGEAIPFDVNGYRVMEFDLCCEVGTHRTFQFSAFG